MKDLCCRCFSYRCSVLRGLLTELRNGIYLNTLQRMQGEIWHIYTVKYYLALKKDEMLVWHCTSTIRIMTACSTVVIFRKLTQECLMWAVQIPQAPSGLSNSRHTRCSGGAGFVYTAVRCLAACLFVCFVSSSLPGILTVNLVFTLKSAASASSCHSYIHLELLSAAAVALMALGLICSETIYGGLSYCFP